MKLTENLIKIPGITFNSHRETDRETLGTHQRVSERDREIPGITFDSRRETNRETPGNKHEKQQKYEN